MNSRQLSALLLFVAAIAFLIWLPSQLNRHWTSVLIGTWILVYLAYTWNIVGGFLGQLSLAHSAFWAIGAYSYVLLSSKMNVSTVGGLAAGAVISAGYAAFIAFVSYRFDIRGHYFALLTLAFTEIPAKLVYNINFLGASAGLHITTPSLSPQTYYYLALAMVIGVMGITFVLAHSRVGVRWIALRDNEQAAEAVGINPSAQKTIALVLSAVLTALGGALHGEYLHLARPEITFDPRPLILVIVATFIGGRGTVLGPLLGVLFLRALEVMSSALPVPPGRLDSVLVLLESAFGILLVLWFSRGRSSGSLLDFLGRAFRLYAPKKLAS